MEQINLNTGNPIGTVIYTASDSVPTGYLVANGQAVSRTTYADLFSAIGTKYGTGNGTTTFTLPDLIDRVIQGSTTVGTYKSAGLPNIKGMLSTACTRDLQYPTSYKNGALEVFGNNEFRALFSRDNPYSLTINNTLYLDASRSSAVYSDSVATVQPPALTLLPCIKY